MHADYLASQRFKIVQIYRSLGCTVVEMLTGNPPWHDFEAVAAIFRTATSNQPGYQLPPGASRTAEDFLALCFVRDKDERPTARDLLRDRFCNDFTP